MRIGEVIIGISMALAVMMVVGAAVFVSRQEDDEPPSGTQSESFVRTFETGDAPHLVIDNWRGPVTIRAGEDGTVSVDMRRTGTGANEQEAFDNLTRLEARVEEDEDGTISVRTFRTEDAPAPPGTRATIEISAPAGSSLDVVTAGGTLVIEGIAGAVEATNSDGVIDFSFPGDDAFSLRAETATGAISHPFAGQATGRSIEVTEGNGGPAIVLQAGAGITIREE